MMEEINEVKKLIEIQVNRGFPYSESYTDFDGYRKIYFQTNENVAEYLNLVNLQNKENALCVAGSGDQAFSLITKGITNIDLFDINKLSEHLILGLKKALILKYNYKQYLKIMTKLLESRITLNEYTQIFYDLLEYMEDPYKAFWRQIIDYNYILQSKLNKSISLIYLLCNENYIKIAKKYITYLNNEKNFNALKLRLVHANLQFKYYNSINISQLHDKKYDVILLSNVLDYFYLEWGANWTKDKLKKYLEDLNSISHDHAIIFLHYVFSKDKPINFCDNYNLPSVFEQINLQKNNQIILKR